MKINKKASNRQILFSIFCQLLQNKKFWLLPLFLVLVFLSLFISLNNSHTLLPAIYALF